MAVSSLFRSSMLKMLPLTFCNLLMLTAQIFGTQLKSGDNGGHFVSNYQAAFDAAVLW